MAARKGTTTIDEESPSSDRDSKLKAIGETLRETLFQLRTLTSTMRAIRSRLDQSEHACTCEAIGDAGLMLLVGAGTADRLGDILGQVSIDLSTAEVLHG